MVRLDRKWTIVVLLLLCWAITASLISGYYWLRYEDTVRRISGVLISLNVGVDFGNSTRRWFNDTKALTGMTFFSVSRSILNMTYRTSSGYGAYVDSIEGLTAEGMYGWVWWKRNGQNGNWTFGEASSDTFLVAPNETYLWYYESGSPWPPQSP